MRYLKIWTESDVLYVAEIDEPTNACSPVFVYPVSHRYQGHWDSTYMSKSDIQKNYGRIVHFNKESNYEEFEKEFFDLIVGRCELSGFKSSVLKNRLSRYGMFYSITDHIKIKNQAQLEESGMNEEEALMLHSFSNKSYEVTVVDTEDQVYFVSGIETTFCDADINEITHPSGEW